MLTGPSFLLESVKSEHSLIKTDYRQSFRASLHHLFVAIVQKSVVEGVSVVDDLLDTPDEFISHVVGLVGSLDCRG